MKWSLIEPKSGSMVRVKQGAIYHYGIFVSSEEIIQFGLPPMLRLSSKDADIEVCVSDDETFLCDGFMEVGIPDKGNEKKRTVSEIID